MLKIYDNIENGKSGYPSEEGLRLISLKTSQIWRKLLLKKKQGHFE